MKQKIVVTALPNGVATNTRTSGVTLKASAAISLQVEAVDSGDTRLKDVKDMLNWAELVKNVKFIVQYNGSAVEAKVTSAAIDSTLWKNLFSPTVKVLPFVQEQLQDIPILSYPVKHVLNYIKAVVEQTTKNFANDLPDSTYYTENPILNGISDYAVGDFPKRGREKLTLDKLVIDKQTGRRLQSTLNKNKFIPFSDSPAPTTDFAQLKNFHGLYSIKPVANYVPVPKPDFEFHDILSILTNYPQLQRKLGLIVDLEFTLADITRVVPDKDANIRIIPTNINLSVPTNIVCPATSYIRTANGFYPRPESGSPIDKGHVKINTDAFTVYQLDTDGAGLKLCQQVDALQLKKAKHIFYASENYMPNAAAIPLFSNEAPRKEGLPSNRTTGIAVARNGMAEKLNKKFNRMKDLSSKLSSGAAAPAGVTGSNATWILPAEILSADDVNLGYRMDIQPEDKPKWFSLHEGNTKYSFINSGGTNIEIPGMDPDEGFIQTSATEEKTDTGTQLKVGEAIARWEGWSLSVPRPGSALNDPMNSPKEVYDKNTSEGKTKEEAKYKTPLTADFKLNLQPSVVKGSLPMLRFGKKYSIKIRTVDLAGNSVPVKTDPENLAECVKPVVKYMRYEPVDAPFLVLGTDVKDGESGEVMVIRSNDGITPASYEAANVDTFHNKVLSGDSVRHVKPPRTTVEMSTTHGMFDQGMGQANSAMAETIYNRIKNEKDPSFSNHADMHVMKVEDGSKMLLDVEYLADPMAAGVAFFISPEDPNIKLPDPTVLDRWASFYFDDPVTGAKLNDPFTFNDWMKPRTFRIRLVEGAPGIDWDKSSRTLKVSMLKGLIFKMNYACFWRPSDLEKYSGVLDMINPASLPADVKKKIGKGQHWIFSPWRQLTLVHAVQQPLPLVAGVSYPQTVKIVPDRNYGDQFATLNTKLLVHGPSTGKLDFEASWVETEDDLIKDGPDRYDVKSKVFHFTTPYAVFEYLFGDMDAVKGNPFPGLRHVFNDTKHRKVNYKSIATTRYKENFFNLIKDKGDAFPLTRESNQLEKIIIPSSARPAAPQIEYVIPTFEWDRVEKGALTLTGRASGLRVYLKRPWYSSGEGEQLAVVLSLPNNPTLGGAVNSAGVATTTWGTDPTKQSAPLPIPITPMPDSFINVKPEDKENSLSVAENSTARVMIVAYDVHYDKSRQLYYADILLNIAFAYYPFIRLALARYQRNSIRKDGTDCCLSPVVQADYIQVPAPRASSLQYGSGKNNITVAISGSIPKVVGNDPYFRSKVQFIIEPIEVPAVANTHFTINAKPIDSYEYVLTEADVKNFTFYHSHVFNLPAEYASKPYRVKVLEQELIIYDPLKPNPNPGGVVYGSMPMKDRMVFADVYEVNK